MKTNRYTYNITIAFLILILAFPLVVNAKSFGPVAIGDAFDLNRVAKNTAFIKSRQGLPTSTKLAIFKYSFAEDPTKVNDFQYIVSVHPNNNTISGIWIDKMLDSCNNNYISSIKNTLSSRFKRNFNNENIIKLDSNITIQIQCKKTCPDSYRVRLGMFDHNKDRFLPIVQGRCDLPNKSKTNADNPIKRKSQLLSITDSKFVPKGWPLENRDNFVSMKPGWGTDQFNGKGKYRVNTCIATKMGTKVLSTTLGKVLRTGEEAGWGKSVYIETSNGIQVGFHHLNKIMVKDGDPVTQRSVLGLSGRSGRTTGPVLSYTIYHNGIPYNPYDFLPTPKKKK
jgi:hypothetical protein